MRKKTLRYTILLISNFLLFLFPLSAQEQPVVEQISAEVKPALYRGLTLNLDVYELGSYLLGGDFLSTEVGVEANLKNTFFPVIEVGFGKTDATEDTYNMHYKSAAPYARIGLNYNTMAKGNSKSYLYVGTRYGFTAVKYDVYGPPMEDGIWEGSLPFEYYNQKSQAHWLEFLVGIKAHIYKNFQMGWSFRYKFRLSVKENPNTVPWYLPGYGKNRSTVIGLTYNLIYTLPK